MVIALFLLHQESAILGGRLGSILLSIRNTGGAAMDVLDRFLRRRPCKPIHFATLEPDTAGGVSPVSFRLENVYTMSSIW